MDASARTGPRTCCVALKALSVSPLVSQLDAEHLTESPRSSMAWGTTEQKEPGFFLTLGG